MNSVQKQGFTLIEVVVTLLLVGLCALLAEQFLVDGFRQNFTYRERDATFFDAGLQLVKAKKQVREHLGECREDSSYVFRGLLGDSLGAAFAASGIRCERDGRTGRGIVYGRSGFGVISIFMINE